MALPPTPARFFAPLKIFSIVPILTRLPVCGTVKINSSSRACLRQRNSCNCSTVTASRIAGLNVRPECAVLRPLIRPVPLSSDFDTTSPPRDGWKSPHCSAATSPGLYSSEEGSQQLFFENQCYNGKLLFISNSIVLFLQFFKSINSTTVMSSY